MTHASHIVPFSLPAARVGEWRVEIDAQRLVRGTVEVRLAPKVMLLLRCFMARPQEVLTREQLLQAAWSDADVGEEVLTQAIAELRRALGESAKDGQMLATVRKRGYQLRAAVVPITPWPDAAATSPGLDASGGSRASSQSTIGPLARVDDMTAIQAPPAGINVWRVAGIAGVVLALTGVVAGVAYSHRTANPARALAAWQHVVPLTTQIGSETMPAVSPDGQHIAYLYLSQRNGGLYEELNLRERNDTRSRVVAQSAPDPGYLRAPAWSSDGRQLAFMRVNGERCRIVGISPFVEKPVERSLGECETLDERRSFLAFDGDDRTIAFSRHSDLANPASPVVLHRLDLETGTVSRIDYVAPPGESRMPRYAADGRTLALLHGTRGNEDLYVVAPNGGALQRITQRETAFRGFDWLADGKGFVASLEGELWRIARDGAAERLGMGHGIQPSIARAASALVFARSTNATMNLQHYVVESTRDAPEPMARTRGRVFASTRESYLPRWSPQGDRVAFVSDRSGSAQLWVGDIATDNVRMLSTLAVDERIADLAWTFDGVAVALAIQDARGSARVAIYAIDGAAPRVVFRSDAPIRAIALDAEHGTLYIAPAQHGSAVQRIALADRAVTATPFVDVNRMSLTADHRLCFSQRGDAAVFCTDPATLQAHRVSGSERVDDDSGWASYDGAVIAWSAVEGGEALIRVPIGGESSKPSLFAGMSGTFGQRDFSLAPNGSDLIFPVDDQRELDLLIAEP